MWRWIPVEFHSTPQTAPLYFGRPTEVLDPPLNFELLENSLSSILEGLQCESPLHQKGCGFGIQRQIT